MKKIIALLLALTMVAAMFVACGDGDKETTTADNGGTTTTNTDGTDSTTTPSDNGTTTSSSEENDETTTSSEENDETTTSSSQEETTTSSSSDSSDIPEGTKMLEKKTYEYIASSGMSNEVRVAENQLVDENFLVYTLDKDTKTASVGDPFNKNTFINGDLVLPEYCYYEGTLYTVTTVSSFYNFGKQVKFNSINLSKYITTLGQGAFNNASFITFNWGEAKVERIEQGAFCGITNTTFTVPATVKFIGGQAFRRANSLKEVIFEGTDIEFNAGLGEGIFAYCPLETITLPEGSKEISAKMFHNCSKLTTVKFSSTIETIAKSAFEGCALLRVFEGTPAFKTIGQNAFLNCSALTSFIFPEGLTNIEAGAFNGTNLMTVNLPSTIAKIGDNALVSNMLKEINVAEGSAKYASENGVLYNANKTTLLHYPSAKADKEFTVPATVTAIEYHAIYKCTKLEKLNLPASLTRIGINTDAFPACNKLQSITVADGNTKYKAVDGVLYSADGKTLIQYPIGLAADNFVVPAGVTKIGAGAFEACIKVKTITLTSSVTVDPNALTDSTAKLNFAE